MEQPWREAEGLSAGERTIAGTLALILVVMFVVVFIAGLLAAGLG